MESEGPYKLVGGVFDGPNGFNFRIVWGPDFKLDSKIIHEEIIKIANQAHAEGRKSMEKEFSEKENHEMKEKCSASWNSGFDQCMQLMKRELGWQEAQNEKRENEFNELLELANQLNSSYKYDYSGLNDIPVVSHKFEGWKKARGIE